MVFKWLQIQICICWISLLTMACGMLSHRPRVSQTCSMGDVSGEYADHRRTGTFSASRNCVQILATWVCALSCWNVRWWRWMNGTTMGLRISSQYIWAFKLTSINCNCVSFYVFYLQLITTGIGYVCALLRPVGGLTTLANQNVENKSNFTVCLTWCL